MDTILYFPRTNPKSRLFQIVKKVPTNGIPKIGSGARFLEFQKYGLIIQLCRFLEFHLYSILFQFSYLLNSKNGTYFKIFDLCISRSTSYFWNGPISGIPIVVTIWKVSRFLEFQKYANSPHPSFNPLSRSVLIQNAMNNLTFYPFYKEFVGYLHFFHPTFEETLEVRDPLIV